MKTLKCRWLEMMSASLLLLAFLNVNAAYGQQNRPQSPSIKKEHADINNDLAAINADKERIAALKERYKIDKDVKNESAVIADKEQIRKAQASLHKNYSYLSADKRTLVRNHDLAIDKATEVVNHSKAELVTNKANWTKAKYRHDYAAMDTYSAAITRSETELNRNKELLRSAKLQRDDDVLAVNRNIRRANGEFGATLYSQNAMATADRWMNK